MSRAVFADNAALYSLRHCLTLLAPLKEGEEERAAGQYWRRLYADMADKPARYALSSAKYDAYMRDVYPEKLARSGKAHFTDGRESTLRNDFQRRIQAPAKALFDALCASPEPLLPQGLLLEGAPHPNAEALRGLWRLAHQQDNPWRYANFLRADFDADPVPPLSSILATLSEKDAALLSLFLTGAAYLGAKPILKPLRSLTTEARWKAEYRLGSRNAYGFYADPQSLTLLIYFGEAANISEVARRLREEEPSLFDWYCACFPERLCRCPSNRRVRLGDEDRRICGLSNRAEIVAPAEADVRCALRVLRFFRQ